MPNIINDLKLDYNDALIRPRRNALNKKKKIKLTNYSLRFDKCEPFVFLSPWQRTAKCLFKVKLLKQQVSDIILRSNNMDVQKKGWFSEVHDLWPGIALSLEINNVLYKRRSKYQDILVVDTKAHGKMLVLDGVIQCTERDEFSYQEGIAFLPLCSHPNPENVLIIGGGDGGVAREVAKHPGVKRITQVEIDEHVLEAARLHLPFMSVGLSDPKVDLQVGDGFQYMRNHSNEFDVIITDSCDPVGPATCLFEESYFQLMRTALRPGGIVCSQSGTAWANLDHVTQTLNRCRSVFPVASYCIVSVPTYPTGQIGFVLGSLNPSTDFTEPVREFSEKELDDMKIRYYSGDVHRAAFVLPRFVAKELLIDNKNVS